MARNKPKVQKEKKVKKGGGVFGWVEKTIGMEGMFNEGLPVTYLPYMMFLVFIGLFYIGNSHYADKTNRKITKLEREVEDLRADYTTLKADYMFSSKQSEVAKRVKSLGLIESQEPPFKIVIQKGEY